MEGASRLLPGSVSFAMTGATSIAIGLPEHSRSWKGLSFPAKLFITLMVVAGLATLLYGGIHQSSKNIAEFICYLGIAILASRLKVNLPGITGTLSVNFLFILVGVLDLSFSETLILGAVAMIAQGFYPDRLRPVQVTFNVCTGAVSTSLAYMIFNGAWPNRLVGSAPLLLGAAAIVYFIANAGEIGRAHV